MSLVLLDLDRLAGFRVDRRVVRIIRDYVTEFIKSLSWLQFWLHESSSVLVIPQNLDFFIFIEPLSDVLALTHYLKVFADISVCLQTVVLPVHRFKHHLVSLVFLLDLCGVWVLKVGDEHCVKILAKSSSPGHAWLSAVHIDWVRVYED